MWFKNLKIFQLSTEVAYNAEILEQKLQPLTFNPCTAGMPFSSGFIPPIDLENAPLVHAAMGYLLICFNIEEKVLPTSVVNQHAKQRIKELETADNRKLSKREQASIKDQTYFTLVQKAFCKQNKVYAFFDTKNNWLIIDTTHKKKLELFVANLKKVLDPIELVAPPIKNIPRLLANWLLSGQYPDDFQIGKNCKLEDFNNKKHTLTCSDQDLFNDNIQNFIKNGCVPQKINLMWQDRITFNLNADFTLSQVKYDDALVAAAKQDAGETEIERFAADFFIMTENVQSLVLDLFKHVVETNNLVAA